MNIRKTEQKKLIIEDIENRLDHPTVSMIYESISEKHSNIGIATVYRNIKGLTDNGRIKKIMTTNNIARYDRVCDDHIHLVCNVCGKVIDVKIDKFFSEQITQNNFKVSLQDIQINGVCETCSIIVNESET